MPQYEVTIRVEAEDSAEAVEQIQKALGESLVEVREVNPPEGSQLDEA